MYWNDPTLYGATLPYKDVVPPTYTPFTAFAPWQAFPRFVPPTLGYLPQQFVPQQLVPQQLIPQPFLPQAFTPQPFNPMIFNPLPYNPVPFNPMAFNPMVHNPMLLDPRMINPFLHTLPINPVYGQPYPNLPVQNWQRPFPGC